MNKMEHLTKLILTPSMSAAVYYPPMMPFQALNYFFQRRWNFIEKIDKIVPRNLVMRCMTLVEELMGNRSSLWCNVMLIHTSSRIHQARIVNGRWATFSKLPLPMVVLPSPSPPKSGYCDQTRGKSIWWLFLHLLTRIEKVFKWLSEIIQM